jgi:hypothetical protein
MKRLMHCTNFEKNNGAHLRNATGRLVHLGQLPALRQMAKGKRGQSTGGDICDGVKAPSAISYSQSRINFLRRAVRFTEAGRFFSSPETRCKSSIRPFALARSVVPNPSVNRL